ncbi:hypothetical protein TI04_04010 [Achromatium sp. WMS2]|nr:hypothetical protein TI04_04010 [Achromatium sp. WMS2]
MAKNIEPQDSPNNDVYDYRIALYGYSGSGKTCLLAALAMEHYVNPAGFHATWLTAPGQTGRLWLEHSIEELKNRQIPQPNPNAAEYLTLDFSFTCGGQHYRVQLIDYAGELISPKLSDTENANRLHKELEGKDALLILAPTTPIAKDNQDFGSNLHDLYRSFSQLVKKRDLPIALVFNMWDRHGDLKHADPECEWQKLEQYLQLDKKIPSSHIPQRVLYDGLQSALIRNNDSYTPGDLWRRYLSFRDNQPINHNFMAFPLSAFGSCEIVKLPEGISFERPKEVTPLQSFGLEDPFFWALYRCDELRATVQYQQESVKFEYLSKELDKINLYPKVLQFLFVVNINDLYREALKLHKDLVNTKKHRRYTEEQLAITKERILKVERIREDLNSVRWKHAITASSATIVVLLSLALIIEFAIDYHQFIKSEDILRNPMAILEDRQWAETYQESYVRAPLWRHWLYAHFQRSRDQVAQNLQEQRQSYLIGQETAVWDKTILNSNSETLEKYLQLYPKGSHADEARLMLGQLKFAQDDGAWQAALLAGKEQDVLAYLDQYPLGRHAEEARKTLIRLTSTKSWKEFKTEYLEALENASLVTAANMLTGRPIGDTPEETELRKDFPDQASRIITIKLREWKERNDIATWAEAVSYLEQLRRISNNVWSPEKRQLVVNQALSQIKQTWDRSLYQDVINYRTLDRLNDYLANAPLQTMRQEVMSYLEYLNKRQAENSFTLTLSNMALNTVHSDVIYKFFVKAKNVQIKRASSADAVDLAITFRAMSTDNVPIGVEVWAYHWVGENTLLGSAKIRLSMPNLIKDGSMVVPVYDDKLVKTGEVRLAISGGAGNEPTLPEWRMP